MIIFLFFNYSMSHLPMHIDDDDEGDWLTHTLATTQNLAGGSVIVVSVKFFVFRFLKYFNKFLKKRR